MTYSQTIFMNKLVENIDPEAWKQLGGVAKLKGMKIGELLNEIIWVFLEKQKLREAIKTEELEVAKC